MTSRHCTDIIGLSKSTRTMVVAQEYNGNRSLTSKLRKMG